MPKPGLLTLDRKAARCRGKALLGALTFAGDLTGAPTPGERGPVAPCQLPPERGVGSTGHGPHACLRGQK